MMYTWTAYPHLGIGMCEQCVWGYWLGGSGIALCSDYLVLAPTCWPGADPGRGSCKVSHTYRGACHVLCTSTVATMHYTT